MCGISGYIGHPKRPKLSYELITSLFDFLETRGTDASGVWGTEFGECGRVIYHKEPIRSSNFIKQEFWKKLRKIKADLLLVHARATSRGGGSAEKNINNHPFVSQDKRIGMVHNGTIEEANFLKYKYETVSETDSECLLRIFEHGIESGRIKIEDVPDHVGARMTGIHDIWSYISTGAMAVAIGERIDEHKRGLFLFRNEKRPLWIADLRELLGQVFFFSSPDIWYKALEGNSELAGIDWGSQKLIELPSNQVWYFTIDEKNRVVIDDNLHKFKLETKSTGVDFQKGEYKSIKSKKINLDIITDLNEQEEINTTIKNKIYNPPICHNDNLWNNNEYDNNNSHWNENIISNDHEEICEKIIALVKDINIITSNMSLENSINVFDYNQLIESLEQTKCDLEDTLQILKN
jgi:glucosamine 6-phosphate synthetase-like amidotransferase/phosphosugar isomerase protein